LERVRLFLFSGTGMTRYATEILQSELEKQQVECEVINIESAGSEDISLEQCGAIGIAYPVHSFNAPKIVIDFAKRLPQVENLDAFIISAAGDRSRLNDASSKLLIKTLRKKGFNVYCDKQFVMPSNFIKKDDEDTVNSKLEKMRAEMPAAALGIINRGLCAPKSGFIARAAALLGRVEWIGAKRMGKYYYADSNCERCGICALSCPNQNIIMENNSIRFKKNCGLCMRCLYICPGRSIKIRRPFKFFGFENWYNGF
jgi:ferredoxin